MVFSARYQEVEPSREAIDRSEGLLLLEFGADWCGHCLATESVLQEVLSERNDIRHLRIADGRGKPLGRSFRVKLWPTLILLRDGRPVTELVRPSDSEIRRLFAELPTG